MRLFIKILSVAILLLLSIILARGYMFATNELELKSWHKEGSYSEPDYSGMKDLDDYLRNEREFLDKAYMEVSASGKEIYNRYIPGNPSSPYIDGININRSYELVPEKIRGGVLILHGLTDSPYLTRDLARIFMDQGYYVLALRYKYHGTHPGELTKLNWRDFVDTARFGARMVHKKIKDIPAAKFFIAGYSTGAAVSLYYTAHETVRDPELPVPDKLFWYSPAMGISPAAKVAFLDIWLSRIPFFKKFQWLDILPEYDSAKYNSFPKNAAVQVDRIITEAKEVSRGAKLPPIYAYTSLEDATVDESKLFQLLGETGNEKGELVIFDANRRFNDFFKKKIRNLEFVEELRQSAMKSSIVILTNYENPGSSEVTVYRNKNGKTGIIKPEKPLIWAPFTFSLAHLSIPISPENPLYGRGTILGEINIKGERDLSFVDPNTLIRLRYNQFFSFLSENMKRNIKDK